MFKEVVKSLLKKQKQNVTGRRKHIINPNQPKLKHIKKGELKMFQKMINFFKEEEGAGLAEYALLLVLIAIVCVTTLTLLGTTISAAFTTITNAL